jgi:hypothetical protein
MILWLLAAAAAAASDDCSRVTAFNAHGTAPPLNPYTTSACYAGKEAASTRMALPPLPSFSPRAAAALACST